MPALDLRILAQSLHLIVVPSHTSEFQHSEKESSYAPTFPGKGLRFTLIEPALMTYLLILVFFRETEPDIYIYHI